MTSIQGHGLRKGITNMKNSENILIGTLLITAGILVVLFLGVVGDQSASAEASSRSASGDYILVTGSIGAATDLLYVIDIPHQKMIVYGFDLNQGLFIMDDKVDLARAFKN